MSYTVETIFRARDAGMSRFMASTAVGFSRLGERAKLATSKVGAMSIFKGVLGSSLVMRGVDTLKSGVSSVMDEFVNFDDAITRAGSKFPESILHGTKAFRELELTARDVGKKTQFTATQAAQALDSFAMAGWNAQQSQKALYGVVDLATVANTDLQEATKVSVDTMGAFGLKTEDAEKNASNLRRVMDVLAKTAITSNTDIGLLYETMTQSGPITKTAGQNIETWASLAGLVANSSVKGSIAGTSLKNLFLGLTAPMARSKKRMNELGLSFTDAAGDMRDPIVLLDEIRKKTEKLGTGARMSVLKDLFGRESISGIAALLNQDNELIVQYRKRLEEAGGSSAKTAEQIRSSVKVRIDTLQSSLVELGLRVLDTFKGKFPDGISKVIDMVDRFDVKPIVAAITGIKDSIVLISGGVRYVWPAVRWFGEMFLDVIAKAAQFKTYIGLVIGGILAYKTAMLGIGTAEMIMNFVKVAKAAGVVNAVMAANPVGAIITGVVLLGSAATWVYQNWDMVKGKILEVHKFFSDFVLDSMRMLHKFGLVTSDEMILVEDWYRALHKAEKTKGVFTPGKREHFEPGKQEVYQPGAMARIVLSKDKNLDVSAGEMKLNLDKVSIPGLQDLIQNNFNGIDLGQMEMPIPVGAGEKESKVQFEGHMTFANAPKGARVSSTTRGAPAVRTEMLGAS
jgi:TP901 family phage tail tape measure protein